MLNVAAWSGAWSLCMDTPPLAMAPTGTGLPLETRFVGEREAAIACSFDEDQIQPFTLAHLTLGASSLSQPLSGPAHLPPDMLRLPLWPCHLPAQVPRAAALPGGVGAGEPSCHSSSPPSW